MSSPTSAVLARPYLHAATAVIVALHARDKSDVTSFGAFAGVPAETRPEDVLFEIGSITKVFTALLLGTLVETGRIDPNRPIATLVPEFTGAPEWITPLALATHSAGLPRIHMPIWQAILGRIPDDPYADFTRADLIAWMARWRPSRRPQAGAHAYSNLGFGLLGEVLAMHEGTHYVPLLQRKILEPLGLFDTGTAETLGPERTRRFAEPHLASGRPATPWTFQSLAGAGALRSSAADLLRLADRMTVAARHPQTPLDRGLAWTLRPQFPVGRGSKPSPVEQCPGWIRLSLEADGPVLFHHDGGTAGSTSSLYVCPDRAAAVVVLANRGVAASLLSNLRLTLSNPHRHVHNWMTEQPAADGPPELTRRPATPPAMRIS